jgi:dihydropteroate synthase
MGILNITPDSFSGDGLLSMDQAVERAMIQAGRFVTSGADILDVGGESTRPGAAAVSAAEEIERVIPVIEALRAEIDVPISIDSYKSVVVDEALKVGADMVNDVWGLRADPKLAPLIAQQKTPVIVMHNRSKPANAEIQENLGGRYVRVEYENLVDDIKAELMDSVAIAQKVGIRDENIILDSGIGFGKTVEQNLELLDRSDEIRDLGYPLLIGTSRKSFIGFTLELPPEKRLEGTAATVAIAIARGADVVRVHDVEVMARVAKMTDAMVRRSN